MIWVRSFPSPGDFAENDLDRKRNYVHDDMPKLIMSGCNYKTVSEFRSLGTEDGWPEENFCMLEWDIALDTQSQRVFAAEALLEPRRVLVAPYRWHDNWIDFVGNDGRGPTPESRSVIESDTTCDSFGLGCIYLPRAVLSEFLATMNHLGFTDYTFGQWYRQKYGPARLTWRVHPQHVHDYSDT
jgi:hypothetical protein